ncbi:hypothetical protein KAR91_61840 [Candidatus Pacearchaeota archaeon]|nr:hypothetical protein [Candidatus Pacearchaeota archaeon]
MKTEPKTPFSFTWWNDALECSKTDNGRLFACLATNTNHHKLNDLSSKRTTGPNGTIYSRGSGDCWSDDVWKVYVPYCQ